MPILEKNIKKEELKTTKEVKSKSLVDLIEKEYLREKIQPGVHNKTKARNVFNKLCNDKFLKGSFDTFCKEQYKNVVKKECPYNSAPAVCKKMDLSGGILNQSCINILREVECLGKYGRDGFLCSTNKIKNIQKIVHDEMGKR